MKKLIFLKSQLILIQRQIWIKLYLREVFLTLQFLFDSSRCPIKYLLDEFNNCSTQYLMSWILIDEKLSPILTGEFWVSMTENSLII